MKTQHLDKVWAIRFMTYLWKRGIRQGHEADVDDFMALAKRFANKHRLNLNALMEVVLHNGYIFQEKGEHYYKIAHWRGKA